MNILERVSNLYWGKSNPSQTRSQGSVGSAGGDSPLPGVIPWDRETFIGRGLDQAVGLDAAYRAIQILVTNMVQLDLKVYKQGVETDNSLIRKPDINHSRSHFIKRTVIGLVGTGNAYWLVTRRSDGTVSNLEVLNPNWMTINYDQNGVINYNYNDKVYQKSDIKHLRLLDIPDTVYGLGPIQACRARLHSVEKTASYGDNWFATAGVPTGVLTTSDELTPDQASQYKDAWVKSQQNRSVAVLGKGLTYDAVLIKPEDAQWIEAQKFNVQTIARMFGVPATWLLAEVGGNSMTYNNQESVWLEYSRNTLMQYVIEIEDALTDLTPNGQVVKFDMDALLRPDSNTRANINKTYLDSKVMTVDEVRAAEGLPPLTAKQKKELAPAPVPAQLQPQNGNNDGNPSASNQ